MRRRTGNKIMATVIALSLALVAGCSDDDGGGDTTSNEKVNLSFWTWATNVEKVVEKWNAANPNIQVTVSRQAQGDELVTKLLTAAKAGNPPDLVQAEYQALPTLVSNDVLADLSKEVGSAKDKFAEGLWKQVTLGGDGVYAIPQDAGPMMMYYRSDLFASMGLQVPKTWDEYATLAKTVRTKDPKKFLTTFSAADPGWFAGLAQQAGASWWSLNGDTWKVSVNDEPTKKVADYWGKLVTEGSIDNKPMYTPDWNTALNNGTLLTWPSAIWGPGVLEGNAAATKGKWAMAPLPQWSASESKTGNWGGSSTGVTEKSKHKAAAAKFALWLNSDPAATTDLVKVGGLYPAARDAQSGPGLEAPPAFFAEQTDFYPTAKKIADTAAGFTWGPNVNVAYSAYRDAFAKAITDKTPFSAALNQMQQATLDDMKKNGFKLAN